MIVVVQLSRYIGNEVKMKKKSSSFFEKSATLAQGIVVKILRQVSKNYGFTNSFKRLTASAND